MEIAQRPKPLDPPLAELVGLQFGISTKQDIVSQTIPFDNVQNACYFDFIRPLHIVKTLLADNILRCPHPELC